MTVRGETYVSEAVDRFQEDHHELALVVDETGEEVIGSITATDALEAVMDEIKDPLDIELQTRSDVST